MKKTATIAVYSDKEVTMRVGKNITFYTGDDTRAVRQQEEASGKNKAKEEKRNTLFAGDLGIGEDMVRQKRMEAQKKALDVIKTAWKGDLEVEDELNTRRERLKQLHSDMGAAKKEMAGFSEEQQALQEGYGVEADSQEQKDLELLLKRNAADRKEQGVSLTKEEKARLEEIDKAGLTDYQQRYLALDEAKDPYRQIVKDTELAIQIENATISAIEQEKLKSAPMVKATKEAEAIKEAASKDIVGLLVEEGIEKTEEEKAEKEEKAEEIKEEKEEQEEILAKRKEEREKAEAAAEDDMPEIPAQDILDLDKTKTDVQGEVQKIMDKMKVLEEDIKGAVVDRMM